MIFLTMFTKHREYFWLSCTKIYNSQDFLAEGITIKPVWTSCVDELQLVLPACAVVTNLPLDIDYIVFVLAITTSHEINHTVDFAPFNIKNIYVKLSLV